MKKIIIPYRENEGKFILHALMTIREYSSMEFEELGRLANRFNNMNDIYYNVSAENLLNVSNSLSFSGFFFLVEEVTG